MIALLKNFMILCTKFLMVTVLLFATAGVFFHWTLPHIIAISLFITAMTYVLSDLVLLPLGGNTAAAIGDFALTLIGSWAIATIVTEGGNIAFSKAPLIAALAVAAFEWLFFHRFLDQKPEHSS
ncbi:MAG TPA: DUF2512 family protein [Bacillales bacterium]|nr:DUF2512 family protein [Bacillales bacterium]